MFKSNLRMIDTSHPNLRIIETRQNSHQRGYNYKWKQARERFLRHNPLCRFCEEKGITTEATVVDHVIPHKGDKKLFWDQSNWQPLCKHCHDSTKQRIERQNEKNTNK